MRQTDVCRLFVASQHAQIDSKQIRYEKFVFSSFFYLFFFYFIDIALKKLLRKR